MKLVFLLEEPSTKYLLDELLPRILPEGVLFQTIPHNGKHALEKSIPRKLRGWNEPGDVRFVILQDQDTKNCYELKKALLEALSKLMEEEISLLLENRYQRFRKFGEFVES